MQYNDIFIFFKFSQHNEIIWWFIRYITIDKALMIFWKKEIKVYPCWNSFEYFLKITLFKYEIAQNVPCIYSITYYIQHIFSQHHKQWSNIDVYSIVVIIMLIDNCRRRK